MGGTLRRVVISIVGLLALVIGGADARAETGCEPGDVQACTTSCAKKDAESCAILGWMYIEGKGVASDDPKGTALLTRACDAKSGAGCVYLAYLSEWGVGVPQDPQRARTAYKTACSNKVLVGCTRLGIMYDQGRFIAADPDAAAKLLGQACTGGDALGCAYLGRVTQVGKGVAKDEAKALELYTQACDKGERIGCTYIAKLHEDGTAGLAKDEAKALKMYQRACKDHVGSACWRLGVGYRQGGFAGLAKDDVKAFQLTEDACAHRSMAGCNSLGDHYAQGVGVAKDDVKAVALFRSACDNKEQFACANLGRQMIAGAGIAADRAKGMALIQGACDSKTVPAACDLIVKLEKAAQETTATADPPPRRHSRGGPDVRPEPVPDGPGPTLSLAGLKLKSNKKAITFTKDNKVLIGGKQVLRFVDNELQDASGKTIYDVRADGTVLYKGGGPGWLKEMRQRFEDKVDALYMFRGSFGARFVVRDGKMTQNGELDVEHLNLKFSGLDASNQRAALLLAGYMLVSEQLNSALGWPKPEPYVEDTAARDRDRQADRDRSDAKSKEMKCKVECNEGCRPRSPGDPCMVAQQKCKRACEGR